MTSGAKAKLVLPLSRWEAQALYDHTGTMPHAPGSWSNNLRDALSQLLATGHVTREPDGECRTCGSYTKPCPCEVLA